MSTNISKQKRKDLTDKIKAIHKYIATVKQDENTRNLLTWLTEIEKELNAKKFGLVFEEHQEAIDENLATHTPVLTENKKLFIDNGGQMNFLIEGDNLAALQLLLKTHKGKIDVIYIDPPYNTGNRDFIYDDNYVDKEDGFKHSKWLSFMEKRLLIAKRLLTLNGLIYISIDDNEHAPLKILCDKVFAEDRFLGTITWEKRTKSQNTNTAKRMLQLRTEYILVYKNNNDRREFNLEAIGKKEYPEIDDIGQFRYAKIEEMSSTDIRSRQTMIFPILGIYPREKKQWKYGQDFITKMEDSHQLILKNGRPYLKIRPEDEEDTTFKPFWSHFLNKDTYGTAETGKSELKSILKGNDKGFDTVKPLGLMTKIIFHSSLNRNITILDFFAGSGTTGQAVMQVNAKDGGERKFIICTNNENNICHDITYERIKNSIQKEKHEASLKYYKIEYIPISDKLYYEYADELLEHIRELVELENGVNFLDNDKIAIVLTDEELTDFVKNIKKHKNCRKLYRAHNVLVSGEQAQKIKSARIRVNVIPDYYYGDLEI
jgi:adenine-specific DNA-methyltransferase